MELEHNVQGQLLQEEIHFCTIYGDLQNQGPRFIQSGGGGILMNPVNLCPPTWS